MSSENKSFHLKDCNLRSFERRLFDLAARLDILWLNPVDVRLGHFLHYENGKVSLSWYYKQEPLYRFGGFVVPPYLPWPTKLMIMEMRLYTINTKPPSSLWPNDWSFEGDGKILQMYVAQHHEESVSVIVEWSDEGAAIGRSIFSHFEVSNTSVEGTSELENRIISHTEKGVRRVSDNQQPLDSAKSEDMEQFNEAVTKMRKKMDAEPQNNEGQYDNYSGSEQEAIAFLYRERKRKDNKHSYAKHQAIFNVPASTIQKWVAKYYPKNTKE
ncbi:MAG: hypothetical protein KDE50_06935 [Caldilineaceae bacterium]|nr:hypothetical protein [Caldilineaceae bacterium]